MAKKTAFGRKAPAFDPAVQFNFGANRPARKPKPGGRKAAGRKVPKGGGS
ncbi:MAG: hypothetical protein K2X82_02705 [Gemmataceae bacterium]|nr:hypothetical protein [Gemmataceae bacterium]